MDWKHYLTQDSKLLVDMIDTNTSFIQLPKLKKSTQIIFDNIRVSVLVSNIAVKNNQKVPIYENELICIQKDYPIFYYIFPLIWKGELKEKYKNDEKIKVFVRKISELKKNKKVINECYNETSIDFKLDISSAMSSFIINEKEDEYLKQNFYYVQAFVPLDVQYLVENVGTHEKYLEWDSNRIYITHHPNHVHCHKINIKRLQNTVNIIKSCMKKNKKITFHLFPCDLNKRLPQTKTRGIIGINNINTGYSWGDHIVLYRWEELNKLIIHEMIHNLECDLHINENETLKQFLLNNILIETSQVNPRESYTEFCANMLHCIIIFNELNTLRNNMLSSEVMFEFINYERIFSMIQASKILNYYGFETFEDIFHYDTCKKLNIDNCEKRCETLIHGTCSQKKSYPIIKQTSNLLSYFITRCILMYHIDELILMFEKMKIKTNKPYFYFDNEWNKYFAEIIMNGYFNKQFFKEMNKIMKWLREKKVDDYFDNNLRMSLIEIT